MRTLSVSFLAICAAAFGQNHGGFSGGTRATSNGGFGSVVYPGTGHIPNNAPGVPLTGRRSGLGAHSGAWRSTGRVVYVPYGYPMYVAPEPYDQPPPATYQQQPPAAPTVIINNNFVPETARPVIREYYQEPGNDTVHVYEPPRAAAPAPSDTAEQKIFLIAFKDHTIYSAIAYWVEGDTLHYVTTQNTHNLVSIGMVDRELSDRLNRERAIEFRLPPAKN